MADGKVVYDVRVNDDKVKSDLQSANNTVKKESNVLGKTAKTAAIGLGTAFIGASVAAAKFGSEFETSIAGAATLFGDVDVDMENLKSGILDLSDASGIAANELGNTLYNALSAGVPITEDAGEALEFLQKSTKLAKAGFTDVDTALSATTKTLNAYGLDISETDRIQKILMQTQNNGIVVLSELSSVLSNVTPTAAAMNVEFEQVGAALANMTAQGTPAAQATTQLNSLFAELGKDGTKASKALAAAVEGTELAGMSFQEMNKAGIPLNDILEKVSKQAEATDLTMLDMFGSIEAGKAALALTGKNSESFTDNLEAMATETDVVGEAFDTVSGTSAEKFAKIMNQMQNVAIELFIALSPLIEEILPILTDLFRQLAPSIAQLVEGVMPLLVELLNLLLPPMIELINILIPALIILFETLMPPILNLMNNAILPLINMLINVIKLAIDPLIDALGNMGTRFINIFDTILSAVLTQIDAIKRVFTGLVDFVAGIFTGDWERAWEGVTNIFGGIIDGWSNMFKTPINLIIDQINGMLGGLNGISIPDWVPGVGGKEFNMSLIPKLAKGGLAFGPTQAIVGDNPNAVSDPEVIAPLSKLEAMLSVPSGAAGGSVVNITVSGNYIADGYDINAIGNDLTRAMQNEGVF